MDSSEQQLVSALQFGNEGAFREIFDRHYPLLLTDIYRIVRDEDACQDLAQELFVDLWNKRDSIDIHTSLRAYLRRAAVNKSLNYLKSSRRFFVNDLETMPEAADDSAQEIRHKESQESLEEVLHRAIDSLPEKCRVVFNLSRFEQLSHREIAEKLGISVKTIENQITKALKSLRESMAGYGELSPAVILWLKCCWMA